MICKIIFLTLLTGDSSGKYTVLYILTKAGISDDSNFLLGIYIRLQLFFSTIIHNFRLLDITECQLKLNTSLQYFKITIIAVTLYERKNAVSSNLKNVSSFRLLPLKIPLLTHRNYMCNMIWLKCSIFCVYIIITSTVPAVRKLLW